jgi:mono/diheme cytochrome c family protein
MRQGTRRAPRCLRPESSCGDMRTFRVVAITIVAFLLGILVLSSALVISEGLSARNKPSNLEYAIANFALSLSKKPTNPLPSAPQILAEPRKSYKEHCAVCHADDRGGKTRLSAGLSPEVPDLRAKHIQALTDGEMFYIIKNGVRFTGMPGWDLGDDETWHLVGLLRQLPKENSSQSGGQ